ncbi:MAG: type I-U CRISPR-associated RAMP protein Csb1/Cas7u [Pirellulales bacterium]
MPGHAFSRPGFDLGPAYYDAADGTPTLLVESAQSMANRLEAVCWDEATDGLVDDLEGMPFVRVKLAGLGNGTDSTCSLLEFHRLNSPYIMSGVGADQRTFADVLKPELGMASVAAPAKKGKKRDGASDEDVDGDKEPDDVAGVVNLRKLAAVCFKYDPNSLVHGVFLEKIAGRLRHPRALSAFIEAAGAGRVFSGGVKFDRALPKPKVAGVDAKGGYGNVPFHRTEFTARTITAYFSLDLAQIRGYGLGEHATQLLITLALWKVRAFLDSTMRLRSACELELVDGESSIVVKRPAKWELPAAAELASKLRDLLDQCRSQFAVPVVTELTWHNPKGKE